MTSDRNTKIGVLDGLIKYMRQLELAKDAPEDALAEGMDKVERGMSDKPMEEMEVDEPESDFEKSRELKDPMAEEKEGEEPLSPLKKEMKDYFNNKDKPKVGGSMTFMVESKKPMVKPMRDGKMDAMDMAMMKKKKAGRPRKG